MMRENDITELKRLISAAAPGTEVKTGEPMSAHTTFRTGGPAALFAVPSAREDIKALTGIAVRAGIPFFILGRGSNLLVSDRGYDGLIIHIAEPFSEVVCSGDHISAGAGASLAVIASAALKNSLTGMEFAAGIPGSLGGAVRMNAGAYGGEIKDVLESADVMTSAGEILQLKTEELNMRYRGSRVADEDLIVLSGEFRLQEGAVQEIAGRMQELAEKRRSKQPLEHPSAGSTFKRPEGYFAGKLIEDAGLKGFRVGGACVSEKHCGFVVNDRNGTTEDVLAVCREVRRRVFEDAGVMLEPEIRFLGEGMSL